MKIISETYFYCPPNQIHTDIVSITGPEAKHLCAVLRCAEGDQVTIVDGIGHEFQTTVERIRPDRMEGRILSRHQGHRDPRIRITLAQAYGRAPMFDTVVEKATELGVSEIIPVISRKSPPGQAAERTEKRLERWQHIAISAMKQSKRALLPAIRHPHSMDELLALPSTCALRLIAWEQEQRHGLHEMLAGRCPDTICVMVGPESGFDEMEIDKAVQAGFRPFSMGRRRLRSETAGPLAVALVLYECGEMGSGRP